MVHLWMKKLIDAWSGNSLTMMKKGKSQGKRMTTTTMKTLLDLGLINSVVLGSVEQQEIVLASIRILMVIVAYHVMMKEQK